MFKNLILVAIRNLWKDKGYSLLNIAGLTIGITFSLFLSFYVLDELSYDRYHRKADQVYRVVSYVNEPEKAMKWANTQIPLAAALKKDYPEVIHAVRLVAEDRVMYKKAEKQFYEDKIFYADSPLFEVFSYSFIEGNPKTALLEPNSMVLTQTLAEKYFGTPRNAFGKSFQNNRGAIYEVTGVVEDVPKNSHLIFNGLISASTLPKDFANFWGQFGTFYTYILVNPNTNQAALEKKMLPLYDKYMASIFAAYKIKIHYGLQPITSIHLHSDMENEPEELGSMSYIYIFSAVALFMLLIASVNYMNLTTARSARRAKEIGIRKVAGSFQSQLIAQFLLESMTITLVSLLLSILSVALLLPVFNALSGKFLAFQVLFQSGTFLILLSIVLLVGLVGGLYPAFYLAKFNPVTVLKGSLAKGSSNVTLRRTLVVVQFTISMIMLICTWIVYDQLHFMKEKDLGFAKEQVLSLRIDPGGNNQARMAVLKREIRKNPKVLSASLAESTPGQGANFNLFSVETKNGFMDKGVDVYGIDEDFFQTLGIKLVKGRNFSFANPADTLRSVIVNEAMGRTFGWNDPLGKKIKFPGDTSGNYLEVVGVVKDFHQKSLYNPLEPLILLYRPNSFTLQVKISPQQVKISPQEMPATLASLEKSWKTVFPGDPFQYTFLDQDFESQYVADQKRGKIFMTFSALTILIACLGLFGLVAFTTQQRQKEISIRKIMGAATGNLVVLIAKGFMLLVAVSCLIAFPIAYYFMNRWLEPFPYKTNLQPATFLLSAAVVLIITLLTVGFHTLKAALANPVKSLRSE